MLNVKKKITGFVLVLCGIVGINFFLFHAAPGDPTNLYFGPKYSAQSAEVLRDKMGLTQPWYVQLGSWAAHILQGDLGYSWAKHRPVKDILKEALPATLLLTLTALFLNMVLGCVGGVIAGMYHNKSPGKILNFLAILFYSIPPFWLALILIYVFSLKLHLLPASGMESLMLENAGCFVTFLDRLRHLILPAFVLGIVGAAATFRFVRSNIQNVLQENYITLARAKGLPARHVFFKHALRNSLIPLVTLLGLYFPFLLSGAFIIEVIFAWPGMGRVTYDAIFAKDFPVLMAVNLIAAIMVLAGNTIADLLYKIVDPRIRID